MDKFFKEYKKVADLIYFDGPLLSLFTKWRRSRLYLLKWVDIENDKNIWLKFDVSYSLLLEYLEKTKTEYQLIKDSNEISLIIISEKQLITSTKVGSFEQLPASYLPEEDVLYDETLTPDKDKIKQLVEATKRKFYPRGQLTRRSLVSAKVQH